MRVDFSDRLEVAGDVFDHHSVHDIVVGDRSMIVSIVDQPVTGQRERLDAFIAPFTPHARRPRFAGY